MIKISYILTSLHFQRIKEIDLFEEACKSEDGIEIVVDYMSFIIVITCIANSQISAKNPEWIVGSYLGGLYAENDAIATRFITR